MKKSSRCTVIFIILGIWMGTIGIASSISSAQEVQRIKPEDLKKLMESRGDMVVVDNQPQSAYDMEHILRAINFPWAMQIKPPVNLPRDKLLILYCACAREEDSTDMASKLMEFGYSRIKVLEGGWLRWVELGYPIEKK